MELGGKRRQKVYMILERMGHLSAAIVRTNSIIAQYCFELFEVQYKNRH
jgi:hypothetical protein